MKGMRRSMWSLWVVFCVPLAFQGCATQIKEQRVKEALAHYKIGLAHLDEQNVQQAYVAFQEAIELNPGDKDALYALGHVYFLQGRYDQAEETFKKILKLEKRYPRANNYLGKVYERKGDLDAAIAQYRKALADPLYLTPDLSYYNLGVAYHLKGELDSSIESFRQAVRVNPEHILAYYHMAQVLTEKENYAEASSVYKEILRRFPESPEARYRLAWVYLKTRENERAVSEFSLIVQEFSDSPQAKRSKKHLAFLKSKLEKLKLGMTDRQVLEVLGANEAVEKFREPQGTEKWLLHAYDLVLRFEDGRYAGYLETPRTAP